MISKCIEVHLARIALVDMNRARDLVLIDANGL